MKWIKGIVLLLISNLLFMVAINVIVSFVLPLFGITLGGDTASLLTMASIYGFTGAFLSLAFSKQMARAMLSSCQQITQPRSHVGQMIYGSVQDIARRLNITMPEVWVYESPDPNAFATGPTKNNSMVAVSTGLLQNLKEDEVRAVLAHEMGHVYNGDMFTTTVLAGLMNTFVYFISLVVRRFFAERDQEGLGFALLPDSMGALLPPGVVVKELKCDPAPTVSIVVAWKMGNTSPLVSAFVDLVHHCVGTSKDVPRLTHRRTKS